MKKAYICTQSDPATDYRIHKQTQTLREAGYEVLLISRSHPRQQRQSGPGVEIMRLVFWHGPLFYAELNLRLFLRLLFGKKADLVVAIDLDTLGGCVLGTALRGELLLFDSHEYFPGVPEIAHKPVVRWVWNRVQDLCVRHADVCVTVCQSIADIFKKKYNRDFHVVRNVPLAKRALVVKDSMANAQTVYNARPFTILYQGAVNVGRGIEETISALRLLPDCRLVVVGNGDVMEAVRRQADAEGVADRVSFEGYKPFDALTPYMASADTGIVFMKDTCPNQHFALPNRTFDFIAAGLPIIGNNLPEISRIVCGKTADGQTDPAKAAGLCIDELTPQAIAEAVRHIQSHPDEVARWKQNMTRLAPELTWEKETQELKKVLAEL